MNDTQITRTDTKQKQLTEYTTEHARTCKNTTDMTRIDRTHKKIRQKLGGHKIDSC